MSFQFVTVVTNIFYVYNSQIFPASLNLGYTFKFKVWVFSSSVKGEFRDNFLRDSKWEIGVGRAIVKEFFQNMV